jgi:tetratricopeptide (TPR) repeat protein
MAMFQILGPVRLSASGQNADLGAAKIRGLLGILLLAADSAVSIDQIVDRLWDQAGEIGNGGTPPAGRQAPPNPRKTLQGYVSKLRALLKKAAAPATVLGGRGYYRLQIDPEIVDYHRFRHLSDEGRAAARQGDHAGAVTALEAAIALWHGRPLADIPSSWATRYGETLVSQDLLPAYHALLDAKLELGEYDEVLTRLVPLLRDHETNESLIELRMRALAAVDGPSSVVACFLDFTAKLSDMLDASPTEGLVQLYRSLTERPTTEPERPAPPVAVRQLPRDIPNFVGRADILRQLDSLLVTPDGRPTVVSLDGGPGIGKTAIATHWAHHRREHFADGILHADLNGYGPGAPTSPAAVLATFLDALGISHQHIPKDVAERASLLRRELAGRRMLILLDNARDSARVRPLLAATSPSPVLITSRQKLTGLAYRDGAHSITVPTLLMDEAIALLQLRIGNDRVVNDLPAIHDLAALCSSIPLALRIAGEHVVARPDAPIPDLVRHLRSQLLDAGSHGDDDSTKLRAVFDWSANALLPEADRLFCLLGLHPSTQVSTPAAAALAGWSINDTERAFDALVGAHLAHQQGADSYHVHDLLHLYGNDRAHCRIMPAERTAAVRRMCDWYLGSVTDAIRKVAPERKPVPPLALSTDVQPLTFEDDQAALHWCIRERSQILAVCRSAVAHRFHDHVWRLVGAFDNILNRFGDPRETIDLHRAALDAARIAGSRAGEAGSLNNLGVIHFFVGEYESALRFFTQALALFKEVDPAGESATLFNIANTVTERGTYQKAIELYQQSLAIAERVGDGTGQARVYHRLGEVYQSWEQPDQAEEYYQRSLALRVQESDVRNQATTLAKLGELCIERDNPQQALNYCEQSLTISRETFDHRKAAEALCIRAVAQYRLGAHDESIASGEESAVLCHALSHAAGEAHALEVIAMAQQAIGDTAAADHNRAKALSLLPDPNSPVAARIQAALSSTGSIAHSLPEQREKRLSQPINRT